MKKVCIIGLGYIGLPTAALIANKGFKVHGVDIQESIIKKINKGKIHIIEPGLDKYVKNAVEIGNLKAASKPQKSDIFIITVPTPIKNKKPDLSFVESAIKMIIPYLEKNNQIIIESTCPVGTTEYINEKILKDTNLKDNDIFLAYCPERVLPGNIFFELENNDRIIGGVNNKSTKKVVEFYNKFVKGKLLETDSKTAEMVKLTENSFRDINIAFANEISILCEENNVDVWELVDLANKHPRVNILEPGPGVGGHCIAVDPWFLVSSNNKSSKLIRTAREVNLNKEKWVINKILNSNNKTVTIYGITFKPDIDDIRESPSLNIANYLQKIKKLDVKIVEPNISKFQKEKLNLDFISMSESKKRGGLHVILVNHSIFKSKMKLHLKNKLILDFKGLLK